MNLVKLFMKQKSMSIEGMSLTLDQSDQSVSDGWPTGISCSDSSSNTNTQIPNRQNINNQQFTNDFSINWLKPEEQRTFENLHKSSIRKCKNEDIMNSSLSIEELTEEISRSNISMSKKTNFPLKTTGIQTKVDVEDNGVQTSLIFPAEKVPFKETVLDKKPVYVFYPNYALPDLSFINATKDKFEQVALKPQNFNKQNHFWKKFTSKGSRPFSCNDIDVLKQRGFAHIKDWESLTFLLPMEYRKLLQDVPEFPKHPKLGEEVEIFF